VPIREGGTLPPFFCVAGVGGNPTGERGLAAALGTDQPVFALQHRGVDGDREPHHDISAMAREFVGDIRKIQPHGPYYLGGFSAGGVAAFEVARQLTLVGERVALLVLLDSFNPALEKWTSLERARIFARLAYHYGARYASRRLAARAALKAEQFKSRFHPPRERAFARRHVALQAAFVAALNAYVPMRQDVATLLVRSSPSRCPDVDYRPHPSNGWGHLIGPEFTITSLDCRHDELLEARVNDVAEIVQRALAAARYRDSAPTSVLAQRAG
jgi:thioesterase domain-containing protein